MEKIVKNEYQGEKMQINKTDNVIYLKEVESNIIEQAFIILKDKYNYYNNNNYYCYNNTYNKPYINFLRSYSI